MKKIISASGAIIREGKLLLIKRSMSERRFPGCWAFPGGKQDNDEPLEDTAKREVKEEVGLDFEPKEHFRVFDFKLEDLDGVGHVFLGEASGTLSINDEVSEVKWLTYDEAKDLDFAFHYKQALEELHKKGLI